MEIQPEHASVYNYVVHELQAWLKQYGIQLVKYKDIVGEA